MALEVAKKSPASGFVNVSRFLPIEPERKASFPSQSIGKRKDCNVTDRCLVRNLAVHAFVAYRLGTMAARHGTKRKGFLAQYKVDERYLLKPDREQGRGGIWRACDPGDRDVLVKYWPRRKGVDDQDLEDIWRSEIRQLQRLAAVPRADDLFVQMRTSGKDAEGFYLVLDPGQGSPLAVFQNANRRPPLVAQPRLARNRRILWANLKRLAEATELLHSQGAIHRNIDPWAVVTALTEEPDFRMTGFEWSMRIAAVGERHSTRIRRAPRNEAYSSFAGDWRDLAHLFGSVLDIPAAPLADPSVSPSRVAEHTSAAEIRLLRVMLGIERVERLDGQLVCARIDEIVDSISAEVAGREPKLCLAVRFGPSIGLSEAIRRASNREIETDDTERQLRFVMDDLAEGPQLLVLQNPDDSVFRHALVGRYLTYRIAPFRQPGGADAATWEFAYCDRADAEMPVGMSIMGNLEIGSSVLEIVTTSQAAQSFPRRHGRVQHWQQYLRRAEPAETKKTDLDRIHQAFALLLTLEMAYAAAEVFPVEILPQPLDNATDANVLLVAARHDVDRARLSEALKLKAPAVRLTRILEADDFSEEGAWTLSETGTLGERTNNTSWRFVGYAGEESSGVLRFEGPNPPQVEGQAFLTPADITGRIAQFKRRLKALGALREHTELLRMLVDPRERIENSQDPLDESEPAFKELDPSKQGALREVLETIPLFLLQGPPGVGKTFLVGDLVRRRFDDEPTTRMLLSAQSNSAVDHLMSEVKKVFAGQASPPVLVRARPADDDESVGELELDRQANRLLQDLDKSKLVRESSSGIRERISALATARTSGPTRSGSQAPQAARRIAADIRAFEGMVLRAANLVFATTNSGAVDRLIEERSLFDWTIVEEAGKATGGELLSPLLLSHRRLMIGDHKQLPPFEIDKFSTLLAQANDVKAAIAVAEDLISRYLKEPGVDDVFEEVESGTEDFGGVCSGTMAVLGLFETLVEGEMARQKRTPGSRPIARRLEEQHRMHPAIARIVSNCFYEGALSTYPKKQQEFLTGAPPFTSIDTRRLPEFPVLFIDLPYSREESVGRRSGDRAPPWSNRGEVSAAMEALKLVRARKGDKMPSLAVLSPYHEQVKALREAISQRTNSSLSHLSEFKPAVAEDEYCGTVDSFQGDEADLVLVSLVRNNVHSSPAKALGFLRDNRRMNVLLSRAKWRMILVGSLAFYRNIVELSSLTPETEIGFLGKFLQSLDAAVGQSEACVIPSRSLVGG